MFLDKSFIESPQFIVTNEDGSLAGTCLTQQIPEFQVNAFGFPLTDIAALNGAKTVQEYEVLLSQMSEYVAQNPDNSKLSMQDIIASTPSFRMQTPAEVERAAMFIGRHWQQKYDTVVEQKRAALAAKAAEASETDAVAAAADAPQT